MMVMAKKGSPTRRESGRSQTVIKDLDRFKKEMGPKHLPNQEPLNELISPIIERAAEVIGDRQEAMRWLGTPVRALDYATPISILATAEGAERVTDVLGQMERGVW